MITRSPENYRTYWVRLTDESKKRLTRKRESERKKSINVNWPLAQMLNLLSVRNLRALARTRKIVLGVRRKQQIINKIKSMTLDPERLEFTLLNLSEETKELFWDLVFAGSYRLYEEVIKEYGTEDFDSPYWFIQQPNSVIGELRMHGLAFVGTAFLKPWLKPVICVPKDVKSLAVIIHDKSEHPNE